MNLLNVKIFSLFRFNARSEFVSVIHFLNVTLSLHFEKYVDSLMNTKKRNFIKAQLEQRKLLIYLVHIIYFCGDYLKLRAG